MEDNWRLLCDTWLKLLTLSRKRIGYCNILNKSNAVQDDGQQKPMNVLNTNKENSRAAKLSPRALSAKNLENVYDFFEESLQKEMNVKQSTPSRETKAVNLNSSLPNQELGEPKQSVRPKTPSSQSGRSRHASGTAPPQSSQASRAAIPLSQPSLPRAFARKEPSRQISKPGTNISNKTSPSLQNLIAQNAKNLQKANAKIQAAKPHIESYEPSSKCVHFACEKQIDGKYYPSTFFGPFKDLSLIYNTKNFDNNDIMAEVIATIKELIRLALTDPPTDHELEVILNHLTRLSTIMTHRKLSLKRNKMANNVQQIREQPIRGRSY